MIRRISLLCFLLLLLTLAFAVDNQGVTPDYSVRALKKGGGKKGKGGGGEVCCPCTCYSSQPCKCDCVDCDDDGGKGGKKGAKKGGKKGNPGSSGKKGDDGGKKGDDNDKDDGSSGNNGHDDDHSDGNNDDHHDKPSGTGDDDDDDDDHNDKPGDDDTVSEFDGLLDPSTQSLFDVETPNPLDPSYAYEIKNGTLTIVVALGTYDAGLKGSDGETLMTPIMGFGTSDSDVVFPGRTVVATAFEKIHVRYENHIAKGKYILTGKDNTAAGHGDYSEESVVDTSIHWAYGAHGYMDYTIEKDGVPISIHLHGGHNDFQFDGNPEFFFSPNAEIIGPRWEGNFPEFFEYDNSQQAGLLFYHDHALGMTRLNVYSGMAGLYVIRDDRDTGTDENPLNLPAFPYEIGLAIMDKMFKSNGEQFYPAFPGDPYYADFINGEGATFPYGKPSLLAEFFGDFITVNGKIWPKMEVEPRLYRLRVLNACDSRFIVMHLVAVPLGETDPKSGRPLPFTVIGGDESVAIGSAIEIEHFMIVEPSSRYDILVDFSSVDGERVIMANAGGDEPFGGTVPGLQAFEHTNKVMAFDIVKELNTDVEEKSPIDSGPAHELYSASVTNVRRVGLFEGKDEYGRLQPLLGTIDKVIDAMGNEVEGTMTWAAPGTEFVKLNSVEEWEVWNLSADAHPFHMHLIDFIVVARHEIDLNATVLVEQPLIQHDGAVGTGYRVENPTKGASVEIGAADGYADTSFPRDVVTALPGQITTIRAKFDKLGDYPWHCHILAHEDHEMMRFFIVQE